MPISPALLTGIYLIFILMLLIAGLIDLKHRIIPDKITLPGILLGLGISTLIPQLHGSQTWRDGLCQSLLGALAGGGFFYLSASLAEWFLKKEVMGGGDVKLMAMIGAFLGWPGVVWTIIISSVSGSVAGIWNRWKKGDPYFPYGPHLALGAILYLLLGRR